MNKDGGSRGGSRNNSTSGGRDYYISVDELVDADDAAIKRLTDKLTKERLLIVLEDTVSHLKKAKSYINNIVIYNQLNSVNDRVIGNNQVKIDDRDKISELTEVKTKVDTLCTASNVKMSSSTRTFYQQGSNAESNFKRQLKFIGVTQNSELNNRNERLFNDKNSIETICFGIGVDVIIEDCRRLARYTQDKNRPFLVTFAKVLDAKKCRSKAI